VPVVVPPPDDLREFGQTWQGGSITVA
jgi:hypothetical protein